MSVSSQSIWTDVQTPSGQNRWQDSYDVCIIGAGIAGLTTAYTLLKEGLTVGVFDARTRTAQGETAFTTAHLASAIDDRFTRLVSIRGTENAQLAYKSHHAAIDTIERIAQEESIDCDFYRRDGYLFLGENDDIRKLNDEEQTLRTLGIPHERLARTGANITRPCLRFPQQGQFHPLKYLRGLTRAIEAAGGVIHTGVRVSSYEGGDRPKVTMQDGQTIQARYVVVATNTPLNSGVVLNTKIAAYQTYAVAAPIRSGSLPAGLYWDTLDPYHYVRMQTHKTPAGVMDYLIVGGEDHKTGQAEDTASRWERLEAWTRREFLDLSLGEVEYRWSGEIFETLDGLALIGPPPGNEPNVFIVTGDSGMGMTHGTIAGMLLPHLLLGRPHPWAELYDPRRLPVVAARTYVTENVNLMAQYRDWVTSGDKGVHDLKPGQSAIIRQGLKKLAVHCDSDGQCHAFSATCPHMGGLVRWNEAEGTWDCPVHGSRFSAEGKVIHGPAVDDLQPVQELALATK